MVLNYFYKVYFWTISNTEQTNLYLKLFKLVSVLPVENEKIFKPNLHSIVTRSLDLAKQSINPHNYELQTCVHKKHLKDLFVELDLVTVRLS